MLTYCVKLKKKILKIQDQRFVKTNSRIFIQIKCAVCGIKKFCVKRIKMNEIVNKF